MKISKKGINLIKGFEACKLTAYICPAGKLTIGWGHTGKDVVKGLKITQERADELLLNDIRIAENAINNLVKVELNQNQYDALVSFVFNVGVSAFKKSTMLKFLNVGHFPLAAGQFDRWIYSKGVVLQGLVKRRKIEKDLFMKPV